MKIQLTIIATFLWAYSWGCECASIDESSINNLVKNVDFIVIGSAFTNANADDIIKRMWNVENKGFNVLFKVDSVLKGKINNDTIVINQLEGGSCTRTFAFGESYIVFGFEIKKLVHKKFKYKNSEKEKGLSSLPPPPPPDILRKKKRICYGCEPELIEYWNKLSKSFLMIDTDLCLSFHLRSEAAGYVIK